MLVSLVSFVWDLTRKRPFLYFCLLLLYLVGTTFEAVEKLYRCLALNRSHPAIREHELPGADLRWVLPAPPRRLPGLHRLLSEIERVLFLVVSVLNDAVLGLNPLSVTLKSSRRIPLPLTYILETSIRIRVHNLIHSLSLVQSLKVF